MSYPAASVYIVDDDPDVRAALQCVLASEDRHVTSYASADDFRADFEPVHPCCLLLDLCLPGMSGQNLLEHLRAHQIHIPVILITAHADVPTALGAMRLGVVDVCLKPVDPQVLLPLVERTLAVDAVQASQQEQVAAARQRLASLTARERQLFDLVVKGQSYKEMAAALGISPRTVEHHRAHITSKLRMDRVADMVRLELAAREHAASAGSEGAEASCGEGGGSEAAEALRLSEQRYRGIVESSRDAMITLEPPSWRVTYSNPAAVVLFGAKSPQDLAGAAPWDLSPARQPDGEASEGRAREWIETALRQGSCSFPWTHARANGGRFPTAVLLTRMERSGKWIIQASIRDLSEQVRLEDALRSEREKLQAVFAAFPVGMLLIDEDAVIIDANAAMAGLVTQDPTQLVGQRVGCGLGCVQSSRVEGGCGAAPACADCGVRSDIREALVAEKHGFRAPGRATLLVQRREQPAWLSIRTEPVMLNRRRHAILAVDELTEPRLVESAEASSAVSGG